MKKFYVLLEDDWELKGNGLGNVAELQYVPSLFLMNLCQELNIKMTFMVDVAQQLTFINHQSNPEIKIQKELWDNNVRFMKQKGFDVQLHLHPQWINAKYEKGFFYVGDNWNIGSYEDGVRKNLVDNAVKYLYELITPIDSEYKIHSFKPGSWGIQPSEGILNDLLNNGIKLVLGVKKGLYVPNLKVDYRNLEEDTYPYYPDFKDITKVSNEKNNLIILPLLPYCPKLAELFKLFVFMLKKKVFNKISNKPSSKTKTPPEIKNLNPLKESKVKSLLKPYVTHLKLGEQPFGYLKTSFDEVIKRLETLNEDNIPVIIETHTKNYINNYGDVEQFLRYIVSEYKDKVEFITLSDFIEKIENGEFVVRHKYD